MYKILLLLCKKQKSVMLFWRILRIYCTDIKRHNRPCCHISGKPLMYGLKYLPHKGNFVEQKCQQITERRA